MSKTKAMTVREKTNDLSPDQIELVKNTVAKGATTDELSLFLNVAKRSGLDPFTRQVHFVKRKVWNSDEKKYDEVGTIQTGIDGYRAVASRTGDHAGTDDAVIEEKDNLPVKATVTVYRMVSGQRVPYTATARFSEYAQKKSTGELIGQWKKMPFLMISKCAEALALRKAFPNDLSGVYTEDEMSHADTPVVKKVKPTVVHDVEPIVPPKPEVAINTKKSRIMLLMKQNGLQPTLDTADAWKKAVKQGLDIELVEENYDKIISALEKTMEEPPLQDNDE